MKFEIDIPDEEFNKDQLLEQGKIELEKLQCYLADAQTTVERILAIQWLLDHTRRTDKDDYLPLREMLIEETEFFDRCIKTLDDPGEEGYTDLTQYHFFAHAQLEFCKQYLENWQKEVKDK